MARVARFAVGRRLWVLVHRWAGLYMASFLAVAGLTGTVLAFYGQLNAWMNPQRFRVEAAGPLLDPLALLEAARAQAPPTVRLGDAVPLDIKPGVPVSFLADAALDPATGEPYRHVPRELFIDPHTGRLVHVRVGEPALWPITRANVLDVILRFHHSLALPGGIGTWLFGIAAIAWTADCFVGFYLTLPRRARNVAAMRGGPAGYGWWARWRPAWLVRWRAGAYKLNIDLHRAGGLWLWPFLLIIAWSSVEMNLGDEVYRPVMRLFFDMEPPAAAPTRAVTAAPYAQPALGWRDAVARARILAAEQGRQQGYAVTHEDNLGYDRETRLYGYAYTSSSDIVGGTLLEFDADTGALHALHLHDRQGFGPWMTDWIVAIHMAQVGGLPMQILIACSGVVTAVLSVTGVVIWWRKRGARGN